MFTDRQFPCALSGLLLPCLVLLVSSQGDTSAEDVVVRRAESWTNVFASRPFTLNYLVRSQQPVDGQAAWRMAIDGRTIARGQSQVRKTEGPTVTIPITLTAPDVKAGVALAASVEFGMVMNGQAISAPPAELWVFPEDPFSGRSELLRSLDLWLFDPLGPTADQLRDAGVPFQRLRNLDAAEKMVSGTLLIGEGVNWFEYPSLAQLVWKLAANKVPVVCFAPASARLDWNNGRQGNVAKPMRQAFRSDDAITSLDTRLDGRAWQGTDSPFLCTWRPEVDRSQLVLRANSDSDGWIWFEADFHPTGHRLILCGLGIVEHWDNSPVPRYLLLRLLENMVRNDSLGDG